MCDTFACMYYTATAKSLEQVSPLKIMINIVIILLFVLAIDHHHHHHHYALADANCPVFACSPNGIPIIRFPFGVQGWQSPSCGYKGFNLSCSDGATVLHLPQGGELFVKNIDYLNQQIQLYDPRSCLPARFLQGLHLSASPFVARFLHNFTFITCPASATVSGFDPVPCLTNLTVSVLATSYASLARSVPEPCTLITTLQVPVSGPGEGLVAGLENDIVLSWYEPYCRDCELEGGTCGLINVPEEEIVCFFDAKPGEGQGHRVFRIIALSIALPAIMLTFAIACFACFTDRRRRDRDRDRASAIQVNNSVMLPPDHMSGLDESTIESFTKLVLGESRRLPGTNDSTCPICLAEYCTKETLRCIPECKHCFHADCIDQWLRLNSTCPLCRKSPSPSPSQLPS